MVFSLAQNNIDIVPCVCLQCSALQTLARIESSSNFAFDGLDPSICVCVYTLFNHTHVPAKVIHTGRTKKAKILRNRFGKVLGVVDSPPVTPKQTKESPPMMLNDSGCIVDSMWKVTANTKNAILVSLCVEATKKNETAE